MEKIKEFIGDNSFNGNVKLLGYYIDNLFLILKTHLDNEYTSDIEENGRIMLQMLTTKLLAVQNLINGINYSSSTITLNTIVDPTSIAVLTRSIYEMTCVFHLIFRATSNKEEKVIIYSLWCISSLKYRQEFISYVNSENSIQILQQEAKEIEHYIDLIKKQSIYDNLTDDSKIKIDSRIRKKEYKIHFNANSISCLDWKNVYELMGCKVNYFDFLYGYLSLYAHPTYVSVIQFSHLFSLKKKEFLEMTNFNLNNLNSMISIFIADYLFVFNELQTFFNNLPKEDQFILDFKNRLTRNNDYAINQTYKEFY